MNEDNVSGGDNNFNIAPSPSPKINKKVFLTFLVIFLGLLIVVFAGIYVWNNYLSESARFSRETQKNYEKYLAWQKNYEAAMTADTYGGKTPQETLDMFIEALKKEDVELASKYFMLNEEGVVDQKWIDRLQQNKEKGLLKQMVSDIEKDAKPLEQTTEDEFGYGLFNEDGTVGILIQMKLNQYSSVWKIKSL